MLLFCKQLVNGVSALLSSTSGKLYIACLAALWLSMAVSTLYSTNLTLSVAGSSWRRDGLIAESAILLFAFLTAAWFAEDRRRIQFVLRTSTVTALAASLYGIAQYFGWDPLLPSKAYQSGEGIFTIVRPPSTFGHADYFADWLVMAAFFALALRDLETDRRWRATAAIATVLALFAIVLSGTRSALLGGVAGALVFAFIARPRFDRKVMLTIAAAIACLGLLYISPAGLKLRARVHWSLDDVRGGARLLIWRDSLHMAMQRPLVGYGPETFTGHFPPFESVALSQAYPDFYQESPHNMFLDALTSQGLPGAFFLVALCVLGLWTARKNAALAAALAAAIVCQQFMVLTIPTALYFFLLLAMIIAGTIPPRVIEPRRFPLALVPVAAVLAIVFIAFGVRILVADLAMALAEHRIESGDVPGATAAYRTASFASGNDLRYSRAMTHLASSSPVFATSVAAAAQAVESGIRATQTTEDRQNAWYNLATIAALRNDQGGVENGLRRAIECAPNWFKPHWTLSQFLELTGRHTEARQEAALALELDGGRDPEVRTTSQRILSLP